MEYCLMDKEKTFKACFKCKLKDCTNNEHLKIYEPSSANDYCEPTKCSCTKAGFNYHGRMITQKEAAALLGISYTTLRSLKSRYRLSDQEICAYKVKKREDAMIVYNGKSYTYKKLSEITGLDDSTIHYRMHKAKNPWTIEEILDPAKRKQRLAKA